jgi:hypothetical protein
MNSDSTFDMKLDKEIAALDCQSEDKWILMETLPL